MKRPKLTGYSYYVLPLGIVTIILIAIFLSYYLPARAIWADNLTDRNAQAAADAVNNYITNKHRIPTSLGQAGYHGPSSGQISYHKDSAASYTFCVTYRRSNIAGDYGSGSQISTSLNIGLDHKAGRQCQKITPPPASLVTVTASAPVGSAYQGVSYSEAQGCGVPGVTPYTLSGKVSAITQTGQSLHGVQIFSMAVNAGGSTHTILVPEEAVVFNDACTALDHNKISVGDSVSVFNHVNTTVDGIIDQNTAYVVVDHTHPY